MTSEMAIIVPSFGRPDNVLRLAKAFGETCEMPLDTTLYVVLQADDTEMHKYDTMRWRKAVRSAYSNTVIRIAPYGIGGTGFVKPTNWMAERLLARKRGPVPQFIGFMGDDHLPRTKGWDARFIEALSAKRVGYVFGDDGFQGAGLTTHVVMKRQIVQALGHFAEPTLSHLYADNIWHYIGSATRTLRYRPDVLIEHMHPHAGGKAPLDPTYEIGNNAARWMEDGTRFAEWKQRQISPHSSRPTDIQKVGALKRTREI